MDRDQAFATLGTAIRNSRERQGLTQPDVVERVRERGGSVTKRSIQSLEKGVAPKQRPKLPSTEPVVAALGWRPGWADRILAGESPEDVLEEGHEAADSGTATLRPSREAVLAMLPTVYAYARGAAQLGADPALRDEFDRLAGALADSIPQSSKYGLAAARPHAEGEGVPADDARRIERALDEQ